MVPLQYFSIVIWVDWVSSLWGTSKSLCALLAAARCFIFLICYDSGVHKVMDFVAYNWLYETYMILIFMLDNETYMNANETYM